MSRMVAWWYAAIATGFLLLALNRVVLGDRSWLIGVRLTIAAGFGALAAMEFRSRK